jgi:hypothetical protein
VTFSATVPSGHTIDWYTTSGTGTGSIVSDGTGVTSFSPNLTATTTYYAQARNTTTSCVSSSRTAVTATVNTPPTAPTGLASSAASVCTTGTTLTLTASGGSAGSGAVYEWGRGTVGTNILGTSTATTYSVSTNAASTYWVRMKGTGACSATTTGGVTHTITVYPPFSAGAISPGNGTAFVGTNPGATITSSSDAFGGDDNITYQWQRIQGTSSVTLSGSASTYSIGSDADNYSTPGTYTFRRYAHDGCNTAWVASTGNFTLTVEEPGIAWTACSSSDPGFTRITNNQYEEGGQMNWNAAKLLCEGIGSGWRLPTLDELECMCDKKDSPGLPGGYVSHYYWSITAYDSDSRYIVNFPNCFVHYNFDTASYTYVKCVK